MLKKVALAVTAFAVGFAIVFWKVPAVSQAMAVVVTPIAGPISAFVLMLVPYIDKIKTFILSSPQVFVTIATSCVGLTYLIVNYFKNAQMLKMQREAAEQQYQLQTANTQLETNRVELENKVATQSEKLALYEDFVAKMGGVEQKMQTEMDDRTTQIRTDMNADMNYLLQRIKELEEKRVPTYVP